MNTGRVYFLIVALAGIALAVVHIRAEQTRCTAGLLTLESRWVQARRQWWALQTRTARLRAPQRLRERLESVQAELLAPVVDPALQPPVRLASYYAQ